MIGDSAHARGLADARISSNRISSFDFGYESNMGHNNNLDTPGCRLRAAREAAGFATAAAAAKKVGVNAVSFRAYENDQHGYSKHAAKLARAFGVWIEWLLEGEGRPPDANSQVKDRRLAYAADLLDDRPEVKSVAQAGSDEIEMIPMLDIAYAMGDGSFIDDFPSRTYLPFSLDFLRQFARGSSEEVFIATGHGDSMEPTLRREDKLMIDTSQRALLMQDQVWALSYSGVGMVKRVRRLGEGKLLLMSDNPSVSPQEVDESAVYLVGRVVWVARIM